MIDKLKNILNISEKCYVLLVSKVNDKVEYQLLETLFKDDELKIERRLFFNGLEEIVNANINNNYPIILHVEGDGIINKSVEKKPGYRKSLIFKADPNEFYFFEYHQNETVFISVARKHYIDATIKQMRDINLYVVHLSFGPFIMANLIPIAKGYDTISSPNHTLVIKGDEILSFDSNKIEQKEYKINGDVFNQRELPLLAAFLDYKYSNPNIEFDRGFLVENKIEVKFKKWFKVAGIFTLTFFLFTLPLSHYFTGRYMNSLVEKESLKVISQQTIIKVNALKEEKKLKEKILFSSGIRKKSFLTRYIMDIGNTVPQNVTLKTVNIIPYSKKIKESKKVEFDINAISISGVCQNNKAFNNWLKQLETLSWIKKIDIKEYSREARVENMFNLSIQI